MWTLLALPLSIRVVLPPAPLPSQGFLLSKPHRCKIIGNYKSDTMKVGSMRSEGDGEGKTRAGERERVIRKCVKECS